MSKSYTPRKLIHSIPKGDLYRGSVLLLRASGINLYNPVNNAQLTGREKTHTEIPNFAFYSSNGSMDQTMRIVRPQDTRRNLLGELKKGEKIPPVHDTAICGYDILLETSEGNMAFDGLLEPENREPVMEAGIERLGYELIQNSGFKPVIHVLLTKKKSPIKSVRDLRRQNMSGSFTAVSEYPNIVEKYLKRHSVENISVHYRSGAIETYVFDFDVLGELIDSGWSTKTYHTFLEILKGENGDPALVMPSHAEYVASREAALASEKEDELAEFKEMVNEGKKKLQTKISELGKQLKNDKFEEDLLEELGINNLTPEQTRKEAEELQHLFIPQYLKVLDLEK
jgi:hypothetical protein